MKSQQRVVVEERIKVKIKDLLEDLFQQLNLLPQLLLQRLHQDHHLRRLEVFNLLPQHLLPQHQGDLILKMHYRDILLRS